jgi:HEAT repeat protein
MAVTMEMVRSLLAPDEPDYEKAKEIGAEALPFLAGLVESDDKMIASKAASLAGMISGPGAAAVLERAARHPTVAVRAAAAHGAQNLPAADAERLLIKMMDDKDPAVSHRAVIAARRVPTEMIRQKLRALQAAHPVEFVRDAAGKSLSP